MSTPRPYIPPEILDQIVTRRPRDVEGVPSRLQIMDSTHPKASFRPRQPALGTSPFMEEDVSGPCDLTWMICSYIDGKRGKELFGRE